MLLDRLKAMFGPSQSRETKLKNEIALEKEREDLEEKEAIKNNVLPAELEKDAGLEPVDDASKLLTEMKKPDVIEENAVAAAIKLDELVKSDVAEESKPDKPAGGISLLDDLFQVDDSDSDTPMRRFIASLPDIKCQELAEDVRKVNELIAQVGNNYRRKPGKGGA